MLHRIVRNNFPIVHIDSVIEIDLVNGDFSVEIAHTEKCGSAFIPSKGVDNGLNKLKKVIECTKKNGSRINWLKCQILREKVNFRGDMIKNGKITISNEKTQVITDFPIPTD